MYGWKPTQEIEPTEDIQKFFSTMKQDWWRQFSPDQYMTDIFKLRTEAIRS